MLNERKKSSGSTSTSQGLGTGRKYMRGEFQRKGERNKEPSYLIVGLSGGVYTYWLGGEMVSS